MGTADLKQLGGGGGKRDRTADLLHAMQALSQLSYTPDRAENYSRFRLQSQRLSRELPPVFA